MFDTRIRKRAISTVSLPALAFAGLFVAQAAHGQTADPQQAGAPAGTGANTTETADSGGAKEIVVTGFRNSIASALNDKRNSDVQIDEINAQDIADFPDSNLAESLQRLPGVSIDRDNGEGRGITVRGLGGDFNRTRLNGMEALSTAGSNDSGTSPNRSRAFDYNTFASELFSSLRIQKTPSAETDEGSLGATIDLVTGKPFDYKGSKFALSTQASYNQNSKKVNPRIAGLASVRFGKDKRMGLLFSGAYNREINIIDQYQRAPGASDYLYRGSQFVGEGVPQRAGFAAPAGTALPYNNPDAVAFQTGSDPVAYAKLFPGAPFNTPGRFDDSQVRIPALPSLTHQQVRNQRLGLTGSYQWDISSKTRLSIDGLYSRFKNISENDQLSPVGLNRNNTNATYNNATGRLEPGTARGAYPGLCTPNAGSAIVPAQDCGSSLYGSTPAFATALDANGNLVPAVLGSAAVTPGAKSPANANIFSTNPNNLDPYDYYNNPNSVGYIPSSNGLAYRGELIGRPGVDVLDANVDNGLADYLVLRNVDFRSAVDYSAYTTTFWQGSARLDHEFSDKFKMSALYGQSKSVNYSTGLLVEFNRMNSPQNFVFDERGDGPMPKMDFGFDVADPNNWQTVKGFSAIRHYERYVRNTYKGGKVDFDWQVNDQFNIGFGGNIREFGFYTQQAERNTDTLNPTLLEAGSTTAANSKIVSFGTGIQVPDGTPTSFVVPDLDKFNNLLGFECNCINKWGDWRLTTLRNGGQNNYGVDEKDKGFYLEFDFKTDLFGHPLRGNAGTRVAITDLTSTGTSQAGRPIVGKNNYTDWLPSMNLTYEPIRNLLVRFSASKVMARPLLGNLSPTITSISIPNDGSTTGASLTIGNPKLSPFRSTNLDASVEWYFAKGGLLSVAVFSKQISSFPQTVLFSAPLSDLVGDPSAIAAIRAQYTNLNQLAYLDNNYVFTARQYRDAPGGYLRGVEVSYQQNFTFLPGFLKNFGALVNYTYIKSQLTYILDPGSASKPQTLGKGPFLGVSPQALNATLFYEDKGFRARISVAHRKGYSTAYPISAGACSPGLSTVGSGVAGVGTVESAGCDGPLINDFVYSKATTNVDASLSFNIFKIFAITAEALNLTNQTSNRYAYEGQNAVTQYASSGRVYRIGARVTF
ncbi:MAG: TonB-dependent receptor [Sphingomonas sp.]|uniref:TonB-dependent receptor n=1 Tax=Sphingomonas sp. TaxID=28214 RepID=UPI003F7E296F